MSANLLLVEDDPGSQELVRALCGARGYGVDVAGDGFLGLRMLSEHRHAIVLIDYHLPEMDGYALARLMREIVGVQGRVKLVGITADRHGLASRRGADALFDAILVKPLDPDLLYATLDRLNGPTEMPIVPPAPQPAAADQAADALWRRRGLSGRPRAVLCPDLGSDSSAAVGQAFALCTAESADLILIGAREGLDALREMRTAGPGRFLPAIDLTGRLGRVCDFAFRVNDADDWTRLVRLCGDFAGRRASLSAAVRDADDPATRLLAFLHVGDRTLSVSACSDPSVAITETGLSRAAVMTAVLSLTGDGLAVCDAAVDGVVIRLTDAGRAVATHGPEPVSASPSDIVATRIGEGPSQAMAAARRPSDAAQIASDPRPLHTTTDPIVDATRVETLRQLIGDADFERLRGDLLTRIRTAFPPDATPPAIGQEAHMLIATAGSLGFSRLSSACRDLQTDISAGVGVSGALQRAKHAIQEVIGISR